MQYRLFAFIFILLPNLFLISAEEKNVDLTFELTEKSHRSEELLLIARRIVLINENNSYDTNSLNESIEMLTSSGLFEKVTVEKLGSKVRFLLTPAKYARDIRMRKIYPLFHDDVEKAMSIHPGDAFSNDMLDIQDSLIVDLYRREGFVCSAVDVTCGEYRRGHGQVLNVSVRRGSYYRMKKLEIRGNRAFSAIQLKWRMKAWRSSLIPGSAGRFVESTYRNDLKKLVEFYRSRKFADVSIQDSTVIDSSNNSINVIMDIHEGDKYKVHFSKRGDRGYRKSVLNNHIDFFKTGNQNNRGIRKSIKTIENKMRSEGFLNADVTLTDTITQRRRYNTRVLNILIRRGKPTTVSLISIQGANGLDEELIRQYLVHSDKGNTLQRAYNPDKIIEDEFSIKMLYRSFGYLQTEVASNVETEGDVVSIIFNIKEGIRTTFGDIVVDTSMFEGHNIGNAVNIRSGDFFRNDLLKQTANKILAIIAEKGYPHATVTPVISMSADSGVANVKFEIKEGPKVTIGGVDFLGAFRTQERVLRKELRVSPGEPLSLKKVIDSQKELRNIGLFSSVRFRMIGLREKLDTVHAFIEVAEKSPYYGTFVVGYQSDKKAFLQAKIGDRNIFGLNKEAWVGGEISQIGYRGGAGFLEPKLFGLHLRALTEIFIEELSELNQDWTTKAYGASVGLSASPVNKLVLGLSTGYERRRLFIEQGEANLIDTMIPEEQKPRNIVVVKPSLSYDWRDSFTRPKRGGYLGLSMDVSKSIGSSLDNFAKVQFEAKGYVTPVSPLTIAGVFRGGRIYSFAGAKTVPLDQRFYLGGTADIRGFDENMFGDSGGGTVTMSATIEARVYAGFNIELAAFTDVGRLENDFESISLDQFRSSAGVGVRYITPIGPIGILYGWKLKRRSGEDIGAFHFSFGYTF